MFVCFYLLYRKLAVLNGGEAQYMSVRPSLAVRGRKSGRKTCWCIAAAARRRTATSGKGELIGAFPPSCLEFGGDVDAVLQLLTASGCVAWRAGRVCVRGQAAPRAAGG